MTEEQPYFRGLALLGTFTTRSPGRPNPIALACAQVTCLQMERGVIDLVYSDVLDQGLILDIKLYTPSLDRVEHPGVPAWYAHWPKNAETSEEFDWSAEFDF